MTMTTRPTDSSYYRVGFVLSVLACAVVALPGADTARAQPDTIACHLETRRLDSGLRDNPTDQATVVFGRIVDLPPETPWAQVIFSGAHLGPGSLVRVSSLEDGSFQTLNAEQLEQWGNETAFFNGSSLRIELIAGPHTKGNFIQIGQILKGGRGDGDDGGREDRDICGADDNRQLSENPRVGRLMIKTRECNLWYGTAFIIDRPDDPANDKLHLTAGHNFHPPDETPYWAVLQFNVPASNADCSANHPAAGDQYFVNLVTRKEPPKIAVGQDWAVFRCFPNPTTGKTTFQGQAAAFPLASAIPEPKMHFPQLPDPNGWDVNVTTPKILADDWQCTETGAITGISFWGSWRQDIVGQIVNIHASIHEDIPDPDGDGPEFSMPGALLWERDFGPGEFTEELAGGGEQGWYDPNTGFFLRPDHFSYFKYILPVPLGEAFVQEVATIYWLDFQVTVADPENTDFGWKTSQNHFNDDAVWGDTPDPDWHELRDPETHESLDLAFVIHPTVRVTGYGGDNNKGNPGGGNDACGPCAAPNGERHCVQQTHAGPLTRVDALPGPLYYQVDTCGGNSGSPVIDVDSGKVIGIHTTGGCDGEMRNNRGTQIALPALQTAIGDLAGEEPEGKMHYPQLPDPAGWNVMVTEPRILADDWLCTETGDIEAIAFWGSWRDMDGDLHGDVGVITNIHVSIHEDVPDPDGPFDHDGGVNEFSHPGAELWAHDFDEFASGEVENDQYQGWYDPDPPLAIHPDHRRYFKYVVRLPADDPFGQEEDKYYWLDIQVTVKEPKLTQFGWKTSRSPLFNDCAVWGNTPAPVWAELRDPRPDHHKLDLAFILGDWIACAGDLDFDGDVDQDDLGILLDAWMVNADGDLNDDGVTDQRDLGILLADWGCIPTVE